MTFRVFQGIGFGAEWGVGAVLVAELVRPESRGRALGRHPERVGRRLGAGRRRLPDRVRALRRDGRMAGADVPRHPAGAADPVRALAGRGPGGVPGGQAATATVPLKQIFSRRAAADDDRRLAAGHGHPGRLLRDVHLDPDVPEEGARPHRRRHQRATCSWSSRARSLGYLLRGLRARPDRAASERSRCSRRWPAPRWSLYFAVPQRLEHDAAGRRASRWASSPRAASAGSARISPSSSRRGRAATGEGFCYNVGRGIGALFPGIIGFLATAIGLGGAVAFGVFGYVLAIFALAFLPETRAGDPGAE